MSADPNPAAHWHQIAPEILMNDVEIALLSLSDVFSWDDQTAVAWAIRSTRRTYDSVRESRSTVQLTAIEAAYLDEKLDRLRARLRFLGEPL